MSKIKTRSPLFCKQMSDEVKYHLNKKSKELSIANWLLIEVILEKSLGLDTSDHIDLSKWLGTPQKLRTGLRHKKGE